MNPSLRNVLADARCNTLLDHERRTLLDALGHGADACVPFPDDACLIAAHKDLEARAQQAEADAAAWRELTKDYEKRWGRALSRALRAEAERDAQHDAVEQEAKRCAREIDAMAQVQDMAVNAWRRRAERAEREQDRLRDLLATMSGVLNALNERSTPAPSMSLRRGLVEQARAWRERQ